MRPGILIRTIRFSEALRLISNGGSSSRGDLERTTRSNGFLLIATKYNVTFSRIIDTEVEKAAPFIPIIGIKIQLPTKFNTEANIITLI